MSSVNLIDLIQSSGGIALNELSMRASESPEELLRRLEELRKNGDIKISGPRSSNLTEVTPEEVPQLSDTVVELSRSSLRRMFAN
jgi:DNA-binding Lrp family transcriptional regulator